MERQYVTVAEAVDLYPIGRSKLYELMAAGHVEAFHLGRRRVVVAASIDRYLGELAEAARREAA